MAVCFLVVVSCVFALFFSICVRVVEGAVGFRFRSLGFFGARLGCVWLFLGLGFSVGFSQGLGFRVGFIQGLGYISGL